MHTTVYGRQTVGLGQSTGRTLSAQQEAKSIIIISIIIAIMTAMHTKFPQNFATNICMS